MVKKRPPFRLDVGGVWMPLDCQQAAAACCTLSGRFGRFFLMSQMSDSVFDSQLSKELIVEAGVSSAPESQDCT